MKTVCIFLTFLLSSVTWAMPSPSFQNDLPPPISQTAYQATLLMSQTIVYYHELLSSVDTDPQVKHFIITQALPVCNHSFIVGRLYEQLLVQYNVGGVLMNQNAGKDLEDTTKYFEETFNVPPEVAVLIPLGATALEESANVCLETKGLVDAYVGGGSK